MRAKAPSIRKWRGKRTLRLVRGSESPKHFSHQSVLERGQKSQRLTDNQTYFNRILNVKLLGCKGMWDSQSCSDTAFVPQSSSWCCSAPSSWPLALTFLSLRSKQRKADSAADRRHLDHLRFGKRKTNRRTLLPLGSSSQSHHLYC